MKDNYIFKVVLKSNGNEDVLSYGDTASGSCDYAAGFVRAYNMLKGTLLQCGNPVRDGYVYTDHHMSDVCIMVVNDKTNKVVKFSDLERISKMVYLTKDNINDFIGKRIKFHAPAGKGNYDYEGVGVIKSVDYTKRNPIEWEAESGDPMQFACFDGYQRFWLSDEGRDISVKVL